MPVAPRQLCPVSNRLLALICKSRAEGLATLAKTLPPQTRAALAYYCYSTLGLGELGLAIARVCTERDLRYCAGRAGTKLFLKSIPDGSADSCAGELAANEAVAQPSALASR